MEPPVDKATEETAVGPKLDKWGLPVATLDDLFPPMGPEIELTPVQSSYEYSLEEIQACLVEHFDLGLDRFFDQTGKLKINESPSPMKVKLLHKSPPVLEIQNFLTEEECNEMKSATTSAHKVNSATFTGALSTRTSTSWFCNFADVPILLSKANQLLNIPLDVMEEPQIVRYKKGQEFSWHYDEVPTPQLDNGGQRLVTLLVYLSDISEDCGGGTTFRDLKTRDNNPLVMQPKRGSALIFFPAFKDGRPDDRTLHKSEVMTCDEEKWITQMWIHERMFSPILPDGNSKEHARPKMAAMSQKLGFTGH